MEFGYQDDIHKHSTIGKNHQSSLECQELSELLDIGVVFYNWKNVDRYFDEKIAAGSFERI